MLMIDFTGAIKWHSEWEVPPANKEEPESLTLEEYKDELGLPNTNMIELM